MKTKEKMDELLKHRDDFHLQIHDTLELIGKITLNDAEDMICLAFTTQVVKIIESLISLIVEQGE